MSNEKSNDLIGTLKYTKTHTQRDGEGRKEK
jgi:hypothetical protein